ncbi:transcriptional regulator [Neobacillus bataviensis LMG 21833]|uniref:Transcriptional regulator n=1 Tax=Neobacillus bataviensis LMG 21833 TaxID=1117379 RepID=K6DPJ5_9BACI|nr:LysR family transcriptional regulator [Neobacillus bataviensis]EKN62716.1 transcriptional regulator [Neobacillus bataviensis LMG 21833]
MQIEQLKYIVSISEYQSFSKAGQALHISQSAISQSVTKLENELGMMIFDRTPAGVKPTEEGKQIIKLAAEALHKIAELHNHANQYSHSNQKHITIGIVSGIHLPFLPKVFTQLRKEFPHLHINFTEKRSVEIMEDILNKKIDIGILAIYEDTLKYQNLITYSKWQRAHMFVFVNKNSPLSSYSALTPKDLKGQTFVMFNGEYMMWFYSKFESHFGPFNLLLTSKNSEIISESIRSGLAIAIEIENEVLTNPYIKTGEIIAIPLKEALSENTFLGLGRLKNQSLSIETKKAIQYLEKELQHFSLHQKHVQKTTSR